MSKLKDKPSVSTSVTKNFQKIWHSRSISAFHTLTKLVRHILQIAINWKTVIYHFTLNNVLMKNEEIVEYSRDSGTLKTKQVYPHARTQAYNFHRLYYTLSLHDYLTWKQKQKFKKPVVIISTSFHTTSSAVCFTCES